MATSITPDPLEDKGKKEEKPASIESVEVTGIFSETSFPYLRAAVLLGLCIFCNEKADGYMRAEDAGSEPLVLGRSYVCTTKECQKKWDELTLDHLKLIIHLRSSFG